MAETEKKRLHIRIDTDETTIVVKTPIHSKADLVLVRDAVADLDDKLNGGRKIDD